MKCIPKLIVIGKKGCGKSTILNKIIKKNVFITNKIAERVTKKVEIF